PAGALGLFPAPAEDAELCMATSAGQLLCLALEELPQLSKGKGNKLISLKQNETVVAAAVLSAAAPLVLHSGKRHMTLKATDRVAHRGPGAARGRKLPRGFTQVQQLRAE